MKKQRLRNLTTGRLHTKMSHVYEDLEFITGMKGIMTHMLPNVGKACEPWLRGKVTDLEYWDGNYASNLEGEFDLQPMNEAERAEMMRLYESLKEAPKVSVH